MLLVLAERRDAGRPFGIKLFTGKTLQVTPFKVCRGYTRLASPGTPKAQDYHWLLSLHPLEVTQANSLALDAERMAALSKLATERGQGDDVVAILGGFKPEALQFELTDMPLASAPGAFSYDDMTGVASTSLPVARGLIESMLSVSLEPVSSP